MRVVRENHLIKHDHRIILEDADRILMGKWAEGDYLVPDEVRSEWYEGRPNPVVTVAGKLFSADGRDRLRRFTLFYVVGRHSNEEATPPQWVTELLPEFRQTSDT